MKLLFSSVLLTSICLLGCLLGCVLWALPSNAQTHEQSATYVSQVDEDLTLRRVGVLPVVDNVEGIYSRPVEAQLIELARNSHRWDYVETPVSGTVPALIELEENPDQVLKLTKSLDADGFFAAAIIKGPGGLSIRLDLFLKKDGKLLAQEILTDHPRFELAEVRDRMGELYRRVVAKIPYEGLILSRQLNRVTINLGKSDGLVKDQTVSVIQIISVTRHPKFNFLVSSEKEILGKVKILKVDDTLSFGAIVAEKERGAIRKLAKISGLTQVKYPEGSLGENHGAPDITNRPDAAVTLGKDPKEWLPTRPPAFGAAGAKLGLGTYNNSVSLGSAGTFSGSTMIYPSLSIFGELWLTPHWTVRADIMQGVMSIDNPRPSSTPGTLNESLSRYSMQGEYNFLLRDDFFGPKMQLGAGFSQYRVFVQGSNPTALTTDTYNGFFATLGGSFPIADDKIWSLGARINIYLFPTLNESPVSSGGSPKTSIDEFSLFVEKKIAENLRLTGGIDFALYSTSFSGAGTRVDGSGNPETADSLSQRSVSLTGGISYLF